MPVAGLSQTYDYVWPWTIGGTTSYRNMPGVIASDILQAGIALGDQYYIDEGMRTVDSYIYPSYSSGGENAADRPYANDVLALVQAWEITGNPQYKLLAKAAAERTMAIYTGAEYADYMISVRHSMAGWDAAAYIYAFYLAGEANGDQALMNWAGDMADRMITRWNDWDHNVIAGSTGTWGYDWTAVSYGHLIKAFAIVDATGYATQIADMKADLLGWQDPDDGWWPVWYQDPSGTAYDDVQTTAYVVEGLNVDDDPGTTYARTQGELFLRSSAIQSAAGDFRDIGSTYIYPEVCAEAVMALASNLPIYEAAFVTAGGWIPGNNESQAHFTFTARFQNGIHSGKFSYTDGSVDLDKADVNWVYFNSAGTVAAFGGAGYSVTTLDSGNYDHLHVIIGAYVNDGDLAGGNIKIHRN